MKYIPIIGLEVHVELKTKSKMFCSCSASYFGQKPNTHTCPVCLGLPGALPVPNRVALEWCTKIALALNCTIASFSKLDRKNYFYPDLAKGYQISQYDLPVGSKGHMVLSTGKKVGITRVHMEEDTGKLTHVGNASLIDFNRSGVPLVEIVTEPDFNSAEEVVEYLKRLQQIVRYLDVSNADMEKGDMRLEPNISLSVDGKTLPQYKVEVKNINSFKFVEKAIAFELERQNEILETGNTPPQETRGWNEDKQKTFSQRIKEEANDYRYFPEPDIPPLLFSKEYVDTLQNEMPELPDTKMDRFKNEYGLTDSQAELLTRNSADADKFEEILKHDVDPKEAANAIINKKVDVAVDVSTLALNIKALKATVQIDENELNTIIDEVFKEQSKAVTDFKNGKESVIMFLVGQVMRKLGKKVDAQMIKESLLSKLT